MVRIDTDGFKEVFDAGRKLEPTAVGLQWVLMGAFSVSCVFIPVDNSSQTFVAVHDNSHIQFAPT